MDRHRIALELDRAHARALSNTAEDYGTSVSVIMRALVDYYLTLPDGEARVSVDQALSDAAAVESARRAEVAGKALWKKDGGLLKLNSAPERRRISLVLEAGQASRIRDASGTSTSVALRALVEYYLSIAEGPEFEAMERVVHTAAVAESSRRAEVGRRVMNHRHASNHASNSGPIAELDVSGEP